MAAADIGANFDNYQGNPVAGGETAGVLKIDTSPIMQMAQYTVMYNKSVWEQTQKDTDAKIAQLADISTLNPNNAIPKDKDEALAAYNELVKYGSDYAKNTAKTPEEKIQKTLEWQAQLGKAKNTITSANQRALGYNAQKADIEGNTTYNAQQKKVLLDRLEKTANSTGIFTPIAPLAPKFDLKVPKIGDPLYKSFDIVRNSADGNGKETVNFKLFDPDNMNSSYLEAQGLKGIQGRKATSDLEQTQFDLENASDNGQQVWNDAAGFLTQAISDPKYKNKDGQVDLESIEANNPLVANIVGLATKWNNYAASVKENIGKGLYNDENGVSQVDAKKYFTIDPTKGISAAQLVYLEKFSKANPDAVDTKYVHTGDATAAGRLAIESKKADTDAIYKSAMSGAAQTKARAYVDNIKQQMKLRKNKQEQDQMLDNLFTRNITQQPSLYVPSGKSGTVDFRIDANASLPMFTFDGKNPKQLIPIGATPVGVDGQPITAGTPNAKVSHYEGGHFDVQYMFGGKPLSAQSMGDLYVKFKQVQGGKWQGSYDDFLKQGVQENQFDARIIGANGATDKGLSTAAQRSISNQATGKGETPVFSSNDSPPTEDVVPTDNSSPDNLDN